VTLINAPQTTDAVNPLSAVDWHNVRKMSAKKQWMQKLSKNLNKNDIITAHCNKCNTTQNVIIKHQHGSCNYYLKLV